MSASAFRWNGTREIPHDAARGDENDGVDAVQSWFERELKGLGEHEFGSLATQVR